MIGETTIVFVGETKIELYKCNVVIAELWDLFKMKIPKAENGDRVADDNHWNQFYATLDPDQKKAITLMNQVPITHENVSSHSPQSPD